MRKFNSFIIGFTSFLTVILLSSCESLAFWNEEEKLIPFEIGDSLFFTLQDINPNSSTYGDMVGPQSFYEKVVLIYFTTNET